MCVLRSCKTQRRKGHVLHAYGLTVEVQRCRGMPIQSVIVSTDVKPVRLSQRSSEPSRGLKKDFGRPPLRNASGAGLFGAPLTLRPPRSSVATPFHPCRAPVASFRAKDIRPAGRGLIAGRACAFRCLYAARTSRTFKAHRHRHAHTCTLGQVRLGLSYGRIAHRFVPHQSNRLAIQVI